MLKTTHFRAFGQRVAGIESKVFICFVIDSDEIVENLPNQFTIDGVKMPPTIYTGTYPQFKLNPTTIVDRTDLKGQGIAAIITDECVFANKTVTTRDDLGIGIEK